LSPNFWKQASTMSEDSILTGRHGREAVWWLVLWKSIFTSRMIWSPSLLTWPRSLKHRRIQRHWWPHESLCSRKGDVYLLLGGLG
jgi:hypothetical protein